MKRGFLKKQKGPRKASQAVEPKPGDAEKVDNIALPAGNNNIAKSAMSEGSSALPTGYKLAQYTETPSVNRSHPANALQIFTIPARVVGQPPDPDGHAEWLVRGLTKNKVLNTPGYPQSVPKHPGDVTSYIVKSMPTLGEGVFATRDISRDGMIFAERPLVVIPMALVATPKSMLAPGNESRLADHTKAVMLEQERQLEVALGRMDAGSRSKFMALPNCHPGDGHGTLNGIARTNGYGIHNLTDGDIQPANGNPFYYSAVCDIGSKITHSCLPNVVHGFKISAFAIIFFAARDIKAGEQLFYSYCSIAQSASERKAEIVPYGITQCTCAACVHATPETDALRKTFYARVHEYRAQSMTWNQLPKFPVKILDDLLKYQRAVVKEGLDTDFQYWIVFLPALATAYQLAGKPEERNLVIQRMMKWNASREKALKLTQ